jgi:AcrR family transcriptional regulator
MQSDPSPEPARASPGRGRPRNADIDERVLDATRHLLTTEGFEQTTMQSVARLAEVGPSSIYRRWPSRVELIHEAIFSSFEAVDVAPSGDLREDLHRFVTAYKSVFAHPAARAGLPGLLAIYHARGTAGLGAGGFAKNMRPSFRAACAAAGPDAVDADLDPDDLLDLLVGGVLYKALFEPLTARAGAADHTADLMSRLIGAKSTEPVQGDRP